MPERNLSCLEPVATASLSGVRVPQLVRMPRPHACTLTCDLNRIMVAARRIALPGSSLGRRFSPILLPGLHTALPLAAAQQSPLFSSIARRHQIPCRVGLQENLEHS